jgi:hypothetical protein
MHPSGSRARIFVHEAVARDGLQIEPKWISPADKVALINGLSRKDMAVMNDVLDPIARQQHRQRSDI